MMSFVRNEFEPHLPLYRDLAQVCRGTGGIGYLV